MKIIGITLLALLLIAGSAFAKNDNPNANGGVGNGIVDIFMTDAANNFTPFENFGEDVTPWLYLKLNDGVDNVTGNWWFWNKDTNNEDWLLSFDTANLDITKWNMIESDNPDETKNIWLTRLDIGDVTAHDQWWKINDVHSCNPNGGGSTKYHVTPEPVSALLFLLGSGAIVSRRFIKRKA